MKPDLLPRVKSLCVFIVLLLTSGRADAQVIAGMRVNGRLLGRGDTVFVCQGGTLTYQAATQGSMNITWNFRKGAPSTAAGTGPVTITYNTTGTDTASQKIIGGAFSDSTFVIVRVAGTKPTASFSFTPDNVCGNIPIQFTSTSVSPPLQYNWTFGDNSGSSSANPSHQFLTAVGNPGTQVFPVELRVTNAAGCSDSITRNVTVRRVPDAALGNADATVSFGLFNGMSTFKKCSNIPSYNFRFLNSSTTVGNNVSYRIRWGDGVTADSVFTSWPAGTVIGHTFPIGSSRLVVEVTGPDGCIGIREYIVFLGTNPAGGLASLGNTDICSSDSLRFVINNVANNPREPCTLS